MKTTKGKSRKHVLSVLLAGCAFFALTERASAQEILLTGPLAGAPAVRKLRLYREGRFEIAPAVSFTLLDEFNRTILMGARLQYNFTDWLGLGVWGAFGAIQMPTALTGHIQDVNDDRRAQAGYEDTLTGRLTAVNLGENLEDQIARIQWVAAPQITVVPFRGKIALFQSIYIDTDLYVSLGPAFVGLQERGDCEGAECTLAVNPDAFERTSRTAIAPTAAFGFSFYASKWSAIGFEYRLLPFSWNRGGFDTAGGGKDEAFPDDTIDGADRGFKLNMLLGVSFNIYLPTDYRVSE